MMKNAMQMFLPKKKLKSSNQALWLTRDLIRLIRKKKKKWKRCKDHGTREDFEDYKILEKEVKKGTSNAKKNYERKLAKNSKTNPKQFYTYLKTKTSNKESVGPLKDENGIETTDDMEKAEILNTFFSSVFTKESTENMPTPAQEQVQEPMTNISFTSTKVLEKLKNLKEHSAPGVDGIKPKILMKVAEEISLPLSLLFQKSYQAGDVPEDWRAANVTPIFKKGKKSEASNYRPVSLTSVLCRVMESIIKDSLTEHLERNTLIKNSQHGFRKKRSCLTNMLEYLEKVTKEVDAGNNVDIIYLDFSKAFDKVPLKRLLAKIKACGVDESTQKWINQWLHSRKQRVVLNGKASTWIEVISGVPQGSVLGPILFIIFINDLDTAVLPIGSILSKFADDTKSGRVIKGEKCQELFQSDINNLVKWANDCQMTFNASKCKVIHFGHDNPCYPYTMYGHAPAGTVLEVSDEEKDVGVWISNNLKPSLHCIKAVKKAYSILGQMSRAVTYRDRKTWVNLYKQYIRPHLEYCVQAWSPWTEQDKKLLESVQERAIKMVSGLLSNEYLERLAELGLPTLEERRCRGDMIQVWKILSKHDNVEIESFFQLANSNSGSSRPSTRLATQTLSLVKPRFRLDLRRNFFSVRVVDPWNELPEEVRSSTSLNQFKNSYDKCKA